MPFYPSALLYDATGGWFSLSLDAPPCTQVGAIVR